MAALSKFELVTAVLSIGLLCATGPLLAEPASAKEKPLYVGDFGARYSFTYDEFRMPRDARAVLLESRLQNAYSLPATQLPTAGFGVRSYRSFSQLMKPPQRYICRVTIVPQCPCLVFLILLAVNVHPLAISGQEAIGIQV